MGIGDKQKSDAERQKRRRQRLADVGIKPMTVHFPEPDRPLVRDLSRMVLDGQPIRQAMRALGGSNEPESGEASGKLLAELGAARNRIAEIEREAEKWRGEIEARAETRERTLQAERDAAKAAETEGRARIDAATVEAQEAAKATQEAERRATEALRRAEKAETAIRQAKTLPGLKGRLVRWLAGDVLPD
jgi:DNA repair exonuclease SbcCD ATPase subunit